MFTVEEFLMIRDLHHQGLNISQISRETGYHRNTVRKYLAAQTMPIPASRRTRPSKLDPYNEYIQNRLSEYPLSGARVHRRLHNSQGIRPKDPSCWRSTGTTSVRDQTRGPGPGGLGRMRSHRSGWQDTDHARSASPGPSPAARSPTYTSPKNSSCQISSFPSSIRKSSGM